MTKALDLGRLLGSGYQLPAASIADSAITTAKIANSAITMPKLGSGTLNGFVWQGEGRTGSDRNTSGSWTDHISIGSFTLTQTGIVDAIAYCSEGYEASAGWYSMRIELRGTNTLTSPEQYSAQGFHSNALHSNTYRYVFDTVPAGTYTIYLQVITLAGSNILNNRNGFDWLVATAWHKN